MSLETDAEGVAAAEPDASVGPTDDASTVRSRWLSLGWDNPLAEPLSTGILSLVLFFVGLGGGLSRLRVPLGLGDAMSAYAIGKMWAAGAVFGNTDLGYPFGQELRYFPTADISQSIAAGIFGALTNDPFLAMNLVLALSFPATALSALWVLRLAGLRGPMAVLASLALTFIPFHWMRTEHLFLATMYPAVLGIGLALSIGSGAVERGLRSPHRVRYGLGIAFVAVVVGTGGVYYAVFGAMFCAVAALYRIARGVRWRSLGIAVLPAVLIVVSFGLALVPPWLFERSNAPLRPTAQRIPFESIEYSGALATALMPAPHSRIPGFGPINDLVNRATAAGTVSHESGVVLTSDFGSLFTCVAIVFTGVGLVVLTRRRALGRPVVAHDSSQVSLGLVGLMLATGVLFFVPWGVNFLFAFLVTPQIRAWDRLVPVLFTLVIVAAAVVWRDLGLPSRGWRVTVGVAVGGVLLVLDSVVPYRVDFLQIVTAGTAERDAGVAYAADLNAAVPGECGVLQLPVIRYPEDGPRANLWSLQTFIPSLTNPTKQWSAGAMKDTEASEWQEALDGVDATVVDNLVAGGFCAIHVDRRGYTPEEQEQVLAQLTALTGPPVATGHGGDWIAFALPAPTTDVHDPRTELDELPDGTQLFYAPAAVVRVDEESAPEVDSAGAAHWWLGALGGEFSVTSIDPAADFTGLSLSLLGAPCADREVEVTLRSGGSETSRSVDLAANARTTLQLELPGPTTSAELTVTSDGPACDISPDPRKISVAVQDPVATFR